MKGWIILDGSGDYWMGEPVFMREDAARARLQEYIDDSPNESTRDFRARHMRLQSVDIVGLEIAQEPVP